MRLLEGSEERETKKARHADRVLGRAVVFRDVEGGEEGGNV